MAAGTITYTPNANFCGSDTFAYKLLDTFGPANSNTGTVTVTVNCVNDVPVAVNDTAVTNRNVTVSVQVLSNDTDLDGPLSSLNVTGVVSVSGGTASIVGT